MPFRELWDNYSVVEATSSEGSEYMNRILDYLKKRAKVEASYSQSLEKLNKSFQLPKPKVKSSKNKGDSDSVAPPPVRPLLQVWEHFMERMEASASMQKTFSEQLDRNLSENLRDFKKNYESERQSWFNEYKKQNEDLVRSYGSFEMAVTNREAIMKKVENARVKYEEADKNKRFTKLEVEKAQNEYNSRLHKFNEIAEELELIVDKVAEKENIFFSTYVPSAFDLLETLETRRIEFTMTKISDVVQSQRYHQEQHIMIMDSALQMIQSIKPADEIRYIVEKNKSDPPVDYPNIKSRAESILQQRKTHLVRNGGSGSASDVRASASHAKIALPLTDDDIFRCPPEKLRRRADKRMLEIDEEIALIEKQRKGIESLFNTYSANPKFGDIKSRLEAEREMEDCEAKMRQLNRRRLRIVEFLNPTSGAGLGMNNGEGIIAARHLQQDPIRRDSVISHPCLASFDDDSGHAPNNEEQNGLTSTSLSSSTPTPPQSGSTPVPPSSPGPMSSMAIPPPPPPPPSDCVVVPGTSNTHASDTKVFALVLYSFEADRSDPDSAEMDVPEGAIVQVLDREDLGWWKVLYNGREGFVPYSYLQERN